MSHLLDPDCTSHIYFIISQSEAYIYTYKHAYLNTHYHVNTQNYNACTHTQKYTQQTFIHTYTCRHTQTHIAHIFLYSTYKSIHMHIYSQIGPYITQHTYTQSRIHTQTLPIYYL